MAQKTQRSRAFPRTLCQRVARIFLTAPPWHEAVALPRGQCDTLLRYGKLATSSVLTHVQGGVVRIDEFCHMVGSWYQAWSIPTAVQTMS